MVKRSILFVSTIFLLGIFVLSCKPSGSSLSEEASKNLTELINQHASKVAAVAVAEAKESDKCTEQQAFIPLTQECTFKDQSKTNFSDTCFKDLNKDSPVSLALYKDCPSYTITLAYWCDTKTVGNKTYPKGICLQGDTTIETKDFDNNEESKPITLNIPLKPQGEWGGIFKKENVETTGTKLSDIIDVNKCLKFENDGYKVFAHNTINDTSDTTNERRFYSIQHECVDQATSKLISNNTYEVKSPESNTVDNIEFKFSKDNLPAVSGEHHNYVIANIAIDNSPETVLSKSNTLDNFLNKTVSNTFTIQILQLPDVIKDQNKESKKEGQLITITVKNNSQK